MNGLLNIDKPEGWTSHDVVARVRRIVKEKRVGHTGTLDPFATGVLVVMVGKATRLAQFLSGERKEYEGVVRLGYATTTGDSTGERLREPAAKEDEAAKVDEATTTPALFWSDVQIEAALSPLRGEIEQVPPMYSAKKIKGEKLYELARRGETVERTPRRVHIYALDAMPRANGQLLLRNDDGTCDLLVHVACSAGTYVRVLAESLGERLGVGAHLASLRRTRAGGFHITDAFTLDELQAEWDEGRGANLLAAPDAALSAMPFLHLTAEEARRVRHGAQLKLSPEQGGTYMDGERVRLKDEGGNLLAIATYDSRLKSLRPIVVLA